MGRFPNGVRVTSSAFLLSECQHNFFTHSCYFLIVSFSATLPDDDTCIANETVMQQKNEYVHSVRSDDTETILKFHLKSFLLKPTNIKVTSIFFLSFSRKGHPTLIYRLSRNLLIRTVLHSSFLYIIKYVILRETRFL